MPESASEVSVDIRRLIWVPAVITLGITVLRLIGELAHWSRLFFNPAPGGGGAIVGISWLPFVFGPYFAVKLARAGAGGTAAWKTFGLSVLGLIIMVAGGFVGFTPHFRFPGKEVLGFLLVLVGPALVALGWPALFKVLVGYGYAARIPVAVVMFFALWGHWGTHYDGLPPNYAGPAGFWGKYLMVAILPQMVVWIAYTVLVGAFAGSFVTALVGRRKATPAAP